MELSEGYAMLCNFIASEGKHGNEKMRWETTETKKRRSIKSGQCYKIQESKHADERRRSQLQKKPRKAKQSKGKRTELNRAKHVVSGTVGT